MAGADRVRSVEEVTVEGYSPTVHLVEARATVRMSDGSRRWCWLVTPDYLQATLGEREVSGGNPAIFGCNMLVVSHIDPYVVRTAVEQMEITDGFEAHTLPAQD